MKLEAIIWDVDGTLVDSEELHRKAFNWAFEQVGLDWHWSQPAYGKLLEVTGGKERIRHFVELSGTNEDHLPATPENIHALKTEFYSQRVSNGELVLRKGVESILAGAVVKGIRLAIATTTSLANVEALFASGVLMPENWEVLVAGDQVDNKKPAPDVYLEALRRLELQPWECIAVEDSENGLKAAIDAGVPTVITTNAYTRHQEFGSEIALIHGLNEGMQISNGAMIPITLKHFEAWHIAAGTLSS